MNLSKGMELPRFWILITGEEYAENERFPHGYGLSYWKWDSGTAVVHLIPFNLLARGLVWLYYKLRRGISNGWWEEQLSSAYGKGRSESHDGCRKTVNRLRDELHKTEKALYVHIHRLMKMEEKE